MRLGAVSGLVSGKGRAFFLCRRANASKSEGISLANTVKYDSGLLPTAARSGAHHHANTLSNRALACSALLRKLAVPDV